MSKRNSIVEEYRALELALRKRKRASTAKDQPGKKLRLDPSSESTALHVQPLYVQPLQEQYTLLYFNPSEVLPAVPDPALRRPQAVRPIVNSVTMRPPTTQQFWEMTTFADSLRITSMRLVPSNPAVQPPVPDAPASFFFSQEFIDPMDLYENGGAEY